MIVNDDFDAALMDFRAIIRAERLKKISKQPNTAACLLLYWRNKLARLDFPLR
ncbi:hypothetical protein OK016_10105 [Vibrio chagasii]|nr:hypothetical protein [Vibrio chagasii]